MTVGALDFLAASPASLEVKRKVLLEEMLEQSK
jgi:hypothetical protein